LGWTASPDVRFAMIHSSKVRAAIELAQELHAARPRSTSVQDAIIIRGPRSA
jgi:hypothetical protein